MPEKQDPIMTAVENIENQTFLLNKNLANLLESVNSKAVVTNDILQKISVTLANIEAIQGSSMTSLSDVKELLEETKLQNAILIERIESLVKIINEISMSAALASQFLKDLKYSLKDITNIAEDFYITIREKVIWYRKNLEKR